MIPATMDLPDSPTPMLPDQPPDPLTAVLLGTAGTWHPGHALYCLWRCMGVTPLATHQGGVSGVEVLPRHPAAVGGHPGTDGKDPHCDQPVPRLRDPPGPGAGTR